MAIGDLNVGMSASHKHIITREDVDSYAELSGDKNPLHTDKEYAQKSIFKDLICHGLFPAGFFSAIFGMTLPGPGCAYVKQSLEFRNPVFIGDEVVATVTVKRIFKTKNLVQFETFCKVNEKPVIIGNALIFVP